MATITAAQAPQRAHSHRRSTSRTQHRRPYHRDCTPRGCRNRYGMGPASPQVQETVGFRHSRVLLILEDALPPVIGAKSTCSGPEKWGERMSAVPRAGSIQSNPIRISQQARRVESTSPLALSLLRHYASRPSCAGRHPQRTLTEPEAPNLFRRLTPRDSRGCESRRQTSTRQRTLTDLPCRRR